MEETLGRRIVQNRKRLGMTQDRLAELLGVTAQAVSKWENDQSCPDINTLPKLAKIFGITTDELLGSAPAVETTVEPSEEDEPEHTIEVNLGNGKSSLIGLAVWLLIAGGVSLYAKLQGIEISVWSVLWTSGLLAYGLYGIWPRFSVFRLCCAAAGGYFLAGTLFQLPAVTWPVILIVLGVLLLIAGLQKKPVHKLKITHNGKEKNENFFSEGERFHYEINFGGKKQKVVLPRLSSGFAEANFGELIVDLSGCEEIADGATVELDCSFGKVELLVPRSCCVHPDVSTSFGDFNVHGQPDADAERTIHVTGSVDFGEGCVRYI